ALAMRTQYRCHPLLAQIASALFYEGRVLSGVSESTRAPLLRGLPTLALHDTSAKGGQSHHSGEYASGAGGIANHAEAHAVKLIVRALLSKGLEPQQIGIICLYRAQVNNTGFI
ncbi:hypothetical protein T492DRAFT_1000339, partial [Pavlovales sp. CCMP2436]